MTRRWQVQAVFALGHRSRPRGIAAHLGRDLVFASANPDVVAVGARVRASSADEAVRVLDRRRRRGP